VNCKFDDPNRNENANADQAKYVDPGHEAGPASRLIEKMAHDGFDGIDMLAVKKRQIEGRHSGQRNCHHAKHRPSVTPNN
jgi:hypothetical protein